MQNISMCLNIERCEMPAMWTLTAVWSAMRVPAMPSRLRYGSSYANHEGLLSLGHPHCPRSLLQLRHFLLPPCERPPSQYFNIVSVKRGATGSS